MKNIYRWFTPFLVGLLIIGVVWFLTDPETYVYFPRRGGIVLKLYTIIAVVVATYCMHVIFMIAILYFTDKKNETKIGIEYTLILLFTILWNTLSYLFITYFINYERFEMAGWIRTSALSVFISFIYYMILRNKQVSDEYNRQTLQLEKTKSIQLETELKYLRAQYHPHFLFNALNTVYFQIDEHNSSAKDTVELLSGLLRYQLYNIEEKVDISEEIDFIKSYTQFQQLRMTNRLTISAYYDNALDKQKIYPLIYQPFLENAFKYVGGEYWINLEMKLIDNQIVFRLENSLPENWKETKKSDSGIGIENIKRRLALLYPNRHLLSIKQDEKAFIVELIITPE